VPPHAIDPDQLDVSFAFALPFVADLFRTHHSFFMGKARTFKGGSSEIRDSGPGQNVASGSAGQARRAQRSDFKNRFGD